MPSPLQVVADIRAIRGNQQPLAQIERAIVAIADSQRGLVTLHQLLGLGLSHDAVERRVILGRLTRIHQGVFAVGTAQLDASARWKAATLACGEGALLCWLPAAALWRTWPEPAGRAHVLIPGNGRLGHADIAMHRMRRSHPDDAAELDGIPVTSLELTCLHLAGLLTQRSFERATIKAARRREFSVERAIALADRSKGRPGVKRFRKIIARDLAAELRSLSELELRFVELLRRHRITMPEVNHDVEQLMVDCVWHHAKAIGELDGFEFHKLPRDRRVDNARTRRLVLAGYRVIRFGWQDVTSDPGGTAQAVSALLALPKP
jgi:very-short-patch-repair endonuclease